jgi:hypothetical protein
MAISNIMMMLFISANIVSQVMHLENVKRSRIQDPYLTYRKSQRNIIDSIVSLTSELEDMISKEDPSEWNTIAKDLTDFEFMFQAHKLQPTYNSNTVLSAMFCVRSALVARVSEGEYAEYKLVVDNIMSKCLRIVLLMEDAPTEIPEIVASTLALMTDNMTHLTALLGKEIVDDVVLALVHLSKKNGVKPINKTIEIMEENLKEIRFYRSLFNKEEE